MEIIILLNKTIPYKRVCKQIVSEAILFNSLKVKVIIKCSLVKSLFDKLYLTIEKKILKILLNNLR